MRNQICRIATICLVSTALWATEIYVSSSGSDEAPGTKEQPLRTLFAARNRVRAARLAKPGPVSVILRGGTYELSETLRLTPEDSGTPGAPVTYRAADGEDVTISGERRLDLEWTWYRDGIYRAEVPDDVSFIDELYLDGRRLRMARYPNYDPTAKYLGGTSPDAVAPERVKSWANPVGGYMHALHEGRWGSKHYEIVGASEDGKLRLRGGWQENRGGGFDPYYRGGYHKAFLFVENIFEELDAPGEWYFDGPAGVLYCYPPEGLNIEDANMVAPALLELIVLEGSADDPVHDVQFEGLRFRYTPRIFLQPFERLLRGDWSIARLAALRLTGAEDCVVRNNEFVDLGGNAVFLSGYARRVVIEGNRFAGIGESAVCLVGHYSATRSQAVEYSVTLPQDSIDLTPGPRSANYPKQCRVHNNLMHDLGLIGKQTAGVLISMAEQITVSHNTIYNVPRAGICINDGCWGGHVIEYNDVFRTVQETGDHGPFNSWGRDRWWKTANHSGRDLEPFAHERAKLDNWETTHIRNNRFAHSGSHSWGIDLDDGSSNYRVYNNLCLGMGVKLREGFFRTVENNVIVQGFHGFHIWLEGGDDVITRNIVINAVPYRLIRANPAYAKEIDHNLFWAGGKEVSVSGLSGRESITPFSEWQSMGLDKNSLVSDPLFVNPESGDYRVTPGSPALKLGFQNFPMDRFGVLKPEFRAEVGRIERSFVPSEEDVQSADPSAKPVRWLGATVKNVTTEDEKSAIGIGKIAGVYFVEVPAGSAAAKAGLGSGDVIVRVRGRDVRDLSHLRRLLEMGRGGVTTKATVYNATEREIELPVVPPPAP